jgi:tRNA pseudouridine38-40 synthase
MVGTLIEVGRGRLTPGDIPNLFALRDRSRSGPTVPPEGLYLIAIEYPDPCDSLASSSTRRSSRA